MDKGAFVVVTTDHTRRGVFSGELVEHDREAKTATLAGARNCLYWSPETKGVLGLAAIGPQKGSRIGPAVPRLELDGVTAVMEATDVARKLWESEPWKS